MEKEKKMKMNSFFLTFVQDEDLRLVVESPDIDFIKVTSETKARATQQNCSFHTTYERKHKVRGVYLVYTCVKSTMKMLKSKEVDAKALHL